ncbi:beta-class carbonic anhydrase [Nocardioides pakistanensis]
MDDTFDDILAANSAYADSFDRGGHEGEARAGLAVITCMDARIDPLSMLGLAHGDAKVIRNAGGRVTPRVLEALVLATHLLGVRRVMVIPHTRCAAARWSQAELRTRISAASGQHAAWQTFLVVEDQLAGLREDVEMARSYPLIAPGTEVGGFMYDVDTGRLERLL